MSDSNDQAGRGKSPRGCFIVLFLLIALALIRVVTKGPNPVEILRADLKPGKSLYNLRLPEAHLLSLEFKRDNEIIPTEPFVCLRVSSAGFRESKASVKAKGETIGTVPLGTEKPPLEDFSSHIQNCNQLYVMIQSTFAPSRTIFLIRYDEEGKIVETLKDSHMS